VIRDYLSTVSLVALIFCFSSPFISGAEQDDQGSLQVEEALENDWNNKPLEPGKYTVELEAEHELKSWKWDETFEVEKDEAKNINAAAIDLDNNLKNLWFIVGILGLSANYLCFNWLHS